MKRPALRAEEPAAPPSDKPTAPPMRDAMGQILAEDGLPVSGPARAAALRAREAAEAAPPPADDVNKETNDG